MILYDRDIYTVLHACFNFLTSFPHILYDRILVTENEWFQNQSHNCTHRSRISAHPGMDRQDISWDPGGLVTFIIAFP